MGPLLVVDIQPAYAAAFGSRLTDDVLEEMRQVPEGQPIVVVSVNEELSGDDADAIREFWFGQGMDEELFERAIFLEKDYAFFRSWMDLGVPEEEIVTVARELRRRGVYDSRELPEDVLSEIAPGGAALCDALFLPYDLESERHYQQPAWRICGGGRGECLREVELWLDSCSIPYDRLDHLTY
jgi:hypothetical protein